MKNTVTKSDTSQICQLLWASLKRQGYSSYANTYSDRLKSGNKKTTLKSSRLLNIENS